MRAGEPPPPPRPIQQTRVQRLDTILERDGSRCFWCGRDFAALVPPTTDHLIPRARGGPSWTENEVAACRRCNAERGHRLPAEWLAECEARGWRPGRQAVGKLLRRLAARIAAQGGQRVARASIDHQLRRLGTSEEG